MNKTEQTLQIIRAAKLAVIEEIHKNHEEKQMVATFSQLSAVKKKLETMELTICNNSLLPKASRDRNMGRMISDSWPLGSTLGELVLSAEEAYLRF